MRVVDPPTGQFDAAEDSAKNVALPAFAMKHSEKSMAEKEHENEN